MLHKDSESGEISERTRITLGAAAGVGVFLGILLIWAIRAESALNSKVDKVNYIEDITVVKQDLKAIKKHLKIED